MDRIGIVSEPKVGGDSPMMYNPSPPPAPPPGDLAHLPILKRVALVLMIVGAIDIAVGVYCVAKGLTYSSSLPILSVAASFMYRGSLRATSFIRWFSIFLLAGAAAVLVTLPLLMPIGLIAVSMRRYPLAFALGVVELGVLVWAVRELGKKPVQAALAASRARNEQTQSKRRFFWVLAAIGALPVLLFLFLVGTVLLRAFVLHR
jgi:hypothetical protein